MRIRGWPAVFVLAVVAALSASAPARATVAATPTHVVIVVTFSGAGFDDVVADPRASALASLGGEALVSQRLSLSSTLEGVFGPGLPPYLRSDHGSVVGPDGTVDPGRLHAVFDVGVSVKLLAQLPAGQRSTLIFVSTAPSAAEVRAGDELGVLIMATGTVEQIQAAMQRPPPVAIPSLTSDSTRRDGAVTTSDIAVTIADLTGTPVPSGTIGAKIGTTDAPAPFDLYRRYRDQRRLTVPIGVATGIYAALSGLFALGITLGRKDASRGVRRAASWAAISIVPLALALLEVGRLPRLTYAGVIPFLVGVTVVLTTVTVLAAARLGTVRALVVLSILVFCVLGLEAAMDWPGAVTPLLGGSQLDGGRFFGLPNAFIGLVLASAVLVALGIRRVAAGALLLFLTGLVIGSPWFGSDLGGAITMCAVAGLWWGVRTDATVVRTILVTGVGAVVGAVAVVAAQRYLASSPTHITQFAEGSGHAAGILGTIGERLRIGAKLLVTHPFAVLPVAGVPVALWAVLRPGERLGPVLRAEPAFCSAIVTALAGSAIAFAVNDTGASALGLGFGSAVAALLFVSLLQPDETVVAP